MTNPLGPDPAEGARLPLTLVYMRVVAILLLIAGLVRAAQVIGVMPETASFENLAPAQRASVVTLLLVDLFACVGLWVGAAWGPVMWAVALAIEVSMFTLFNDLFGLYLLGVAAHLAVFCGFLALTFVEWRRSLSE